MKFTEALSNYLDARDAAYRVRGSKHYEPAALAVLNAEAGVLDELFAVMSQPLVMVQPAPPNTPKGKNRK
jgi:hypothetical protein